MATEDGRRHNGDNNRRKTHCPKGHPLSGDNLLTSKLKIGKRECRTCHNARRRAANAAKRKEQANG
jgi:hypothetical protein